ncbi:fluoride efflux transporter FluC [Leucobacter luti]|uniref:Fluoride-specific ion channel FluC n=1 Tax=Leucobacter luti TaxID=340320 RepID=A0A4Q7TMX6_9MICO|nr:CrcB family protein [Leucobacter luti]MBL3700217.1 CrcB family protein [Leucobacter luti]RZT61060.1 camphor resistance protein CrcB [Leucobacter luti]
MASRGDAAGRAGAASGVSLTTLGLVALGGAAGSLARYGVALALGDAGGWPLATLAVNLGGALMLGVVLERYAGGTDRSPRGRARLLLGTGVLGGFTTYSLVAGQLAELLLSGATLLALGYAAATLLGGLALSAVGVWLGRRWRGAELARGAARLAPAPQAGEPQ